MEHASESVRYEEHAHQNMTNIQKGDSSDTQFSFIWETEGDNDLIYGDCGTTPSEKIIAFDLDQTLIKTKSGAKFPKDADDWVMLHDRVIPCLHEYYKNGYKLVIFTNQGGIEKGITPAQIVQEKLQKMVKFIGIPMQVFIAPKTNRFRKPFPGMWTYLVNNSNAGVKINFKESIYCGDAAGRPRDNTRRADFSDSDYRFSLNIGLKFKTPETLFDNEDSILPPIEFDPRNLKATGSVIKDKDMSQLRMEGREMIIFVGSPASGKTRFWRNHLADYVHVNNNTLKTKARCLKAAEEGLKEGKSVVIDNVNTTVQARKEYIDLAKKYDYPVRCFYFEVSKEFAFHLDTLRIDNKYAQIEGTKVGKVPVHAFFKIFEMPTTDEGFLEVETIEFIPGPFENKEDEMLFYCFL